MTFINWINIGIVVIILVGGICATIYYRKKLRDLDGFMGIDPPESNENNAYDISADS